MNDQTNKNQVDTKPIKQDDGIISFVCDWSSNNPIASLVLGAAMMIWYDLGGLAASWNPLSFDYGYGKGIIFWLWSRPLGVFLLANGLYSIWERRFSKSKTEETE